MSTATGIAFDRICLAVGLPRPVAEYRFHLTRRWRFDYAWPDALVALEVEGGVFARVVGRHARGAGFRDDLLKYSEAAILGWCVVRVLPEQIPQPALDLVRRALERRR